jgi:exopolyphosphatase/pppGpp-phosphohydrolase
VKALERHVMRTIGDLLDRARRRGVTSVIGTSGTINTLVAMALAARGEEAGRLHGVSSRARRSTRSGVACSRPTAAHAPTCPAWTRSAST